PPCDILPLPAPSRGGPSRMPFRDRWFRIAPLPFALILGLACDRGRSPAPAGQRDAAAPAATAGEGALSIVSWAGYMERGETDRSYDWVTGFERDSGCKVTVKTAATSDEMVALMNQGGFDLVTASGDATLRLVSGGRVREIEPARIPSWSTIDPRLQNA